MVWKEGMTGTMTDSIWTFESLLRLAGVNHFISTRLGGVSNYPFESLNMGFHVDDDPRAVLANRKELCRQAGVPLVNLTTAKQVHGSTVAVVTGAMKGRGSDDFNLALNDTDAMVTDVPGVCLMVVVADCVPVLLADPVSRAVGVAHAGWRGTIAGISRRTEEMLYKNYGCRPQDIVVGIGPSIGPCCYQVGQEVFERFKTGFGSQAVKAEEDTGSSGNYVDLWETNRMQLLGAGVPPENIEVSRVCTCCNHHRFFSARRCGGTTGRFGAGIMLKP